VCYCSASDIFAFGLPRGSLPFPARLIASVSAGTDALALDGHGFEADHPISFRAEGGGALPSPLVEGVGYFALPVDESHFQVATEAGGSAVNITTSGSGVLVIAALPVDSARQWASRMVDDMLPAHVVPLTAPYPEIVVATCAELAACKLARFTGAATKSVGEILDYAQKRLERWARGVPIRGTNAPTSAGMAVTASSAGRDTRGWRQYGGIG